MSIQSFIILGSYIHSTKASSSFFVVNKKINMLLHDLSWIAIIMQSFTPVSCLVFEVCQSKLNKKKKKTNIENELF